jgi:hypothetical protein
MLLTQDHALPVGFGINVVTPSNFTVIVLDVYFNRYSQRSVLKQT